MNKQLIHTLPLLLLLGGFAAGCGLDRPTGPGAQEPDWESVQLSTVSQGQGDEAVELTLRPDGRFVLVDRRGEEATTRGLLAGEKLETLARLIGALPPPLDASPSPCNSETYSLSVTRGGEVSLYQWTDCDGAASEVEAVRGVLAAVAQEAGEHRVRPVPFRILTEGTSSGLTSRRAQVLRDRDALVRLAREHRPGEAVAVPRVDFTKEVVAVCFLGEFPRGGYEVTVEGVEMTDSGWLRVRTLESSLAEGCAAPEMPVQPFVWVAIESTGADLYFETATVTRACGGSPLDAGASGVRF